MHLEVERVLREHALITAGERVLVAVSGGPDSVALLHVLCSLAPRLSFTLHAAHLDHGLRTESAAEAAFVQRLCARLGVSLTSERRAVAHRSEGGLEQEARRVRRAFLANAADAADCSQIALGHHRDDQAETFLLRLLRGSGPAGLAAMRPRSGRFIRPLLFCPRHQIKDYLAAQRLDFIHDPSNADLAYTRNRIRHRLVPLLKSFNPQIDLRLDRLSRRLALEEDFWSQQVDAALADVFQSARDGCRLCLGGLAAQHPALRDRVVRRAIENVRGDLRGIEEIHLEQINRLLANGPVQGEAHLPGLWAGRRYDWLWLCSAPPDGFAEYRIMVDGPGRYELPGGGCLVVTLADRQAGEGRWVAEFDLSTTSFPFLVRTFAPGDRLHPAGFDGRKKIKDLFIEKRIEKEARRRIPLVVCRDEVLWVVGMRRCRGHRPHHAGRKVLRIAAEGLEDGV